MIFFFGLEMHQWLSACITVILFPFFNFKFTVYFRVTFHFYWKLGQQLDLSAHSSIHQKFTEYLPNAIACADAVNASQDLVLIFQELRVSLMDMYISNDVITSTFLMVQWLRVSIPNTGGQGSIRGQGTRFHMLQLRVCMPQLQDATCWHR